jgi:hypothetical protein
MLWITLTTANGRELLDAVNFMIMENGRYCLLLLDGTQREGHISEISFLHVEAVTEN